MSEGDIESGTNGSIEVRSSFELSRMTVVLYPSFSWDDQAYHLDKDPEHRTFAEILVDVIAADVIEPWGGGKWHLEVFRSTVPDPEEWNGEM